MQDGAGEGRAVYDVPTPLLATPSGEVFFTDRQGEMPLILLCINVMNNRHHRLSK